MEIIIRSAHGIEYELGSAQEPWPNHSLQHRTWSNGSPLVCENTKVVRIITICCE